ncbi:MAG: helix-turn-helix transcriptional regulator [Proteobacteria bacterium]|nr:helix-turn-helix transcriptional regulator [Pseudomonadota bacterium]
MIKLSTFEDYLTKQFGKKAASKQGKFEVDSFAFKLGYLLKEARIAANLTQEQLAEKTGTKGSYISRIECGKSEIQLSTLCRIIEIGLEKELNISIL